jgi:plastocyanin
MFRTAARIVLLIVATTAMLLAGGIEGQVVIKRKLSRRTVTSPAGTYYRGTAVELASEPVDDPLVFERTHVVVYLEGRSVSAPVTAILGQKNRRFTEDLLVVPAGSTVSFPNEDPIFHNVFSLSKPKTFDLGTYPKGQTRTVTLTTPGIIYVNCHLHPNMSAAIVVTPNRWSVRPDRSGAFSFEGVPPGKYTVVAWHKSAGFFRQPVEIKSDETASKLVFVIPFNEDGSVSTASRR